MDFQSWRDFDWRRGVTGALGLFQAFRRETNLLIAGLTGISGVATGGCPESGFVSDARSTARHFGVAIVSHDCRPTLLFVWAVEQARFDCRSDPSTQQACC